MSNVPVAGPKIVCLCGSLRFSREFATERTRLTLDLAIVLAPEATEASVLDPLLVRALGELHLRRIDLADEPRWLHRGGHPSRDRVRRRIGQARHVLPRTGYEGQLVGVSDPITSRQHGQTCLSASMPRFTKGARTSGRQLNVSPHRCPRRLCGGLEHP